uniref:Uncharacterized protein n=1 Tax=Arundo donax TaxID=35708 RepID=A0A0A8ZEJ5_ARUDO
MHCNVSPVQVYNIGGPRYILTHIYYMERQGLSFHLKNRSNLSFSLRTKPPRREDSYTHSNLHSVDCKQ